MALYHQEPGAKHRYGWDFENIVTPGTDLSAATFASEPAGLVIDSLIVEGSIVTAMVSSNGATGLYKAICLVTLPDGRVRNPAHVIRFQ